MSNLERKLLFSSNNIYKITEIRAKLGSQFEILGLQDLGILEDIPETGLTLKDNALIKARYLYNRLNMNCFADDTGLMVDALDGEPGVYSARYAGEPKDDRANIQKLLERLEGNTMRAAQFTTVIAMIFDGEEYLFEGIIKGSILTEPRGSNGFGYDSIFQPIASKLSFAEMNQAQKNSISHRALAVDKLAESLLRMI